MIHLTTSACLQQQICMWGTTRHLQQLFETERPMHGHICSCRDTFLTTVYSKVSKKWTSLEIKVSHCSGNGEKQHIHWWMIVMQSQVVFEIIPIHHRAHYIAYIKSNWRKWPMAYQLFLTAKKFANMCVKNNFDAFSMIHLKANVFPC